MEYKQSGAIRDNKTTPHNMLWVGFTITLKGKPPAPSCPLIPPPRLALRLFRAAVSSTYATPAIIVTISYDIGMASD